MRSKNIRCTIFLLPSSESLFLFLLDAKNHHITHCLHVRDGSYVSVCNNMQHSRNHEVPLQYALIMGIRTPQDKFVMYSEEFLSSCSFEFLPVHRTIHVHRAVVDNSIINRLNLFIS